MGSVHEGCRGCPTVFVVGHLVTCILCAKAAPQSLLQVIWLHGFCARRLPYSLCCKSFGYMGSVHEGCPTVFAAGHLVTWVLCTKAALQSLLQVIWLHGFCARRLPWLPHSLCCRSFGYMGSVHEGCPTVFAAGHLVTWVLCTKAAVAAPQSLLQVIWLHGFCARRLPYSLCCRSFGYMGSVHEGCPTVFAAGHLVTWVLCTKAAPVFAAGHLVTWVLCTKAAPVFAAGHLVTWVLCTKAAPQSLLQVIWLHGFCARRLPQSLLQVIWLHGFCARRLPHSLCCRSFGYMGSVHEGCPTVFAAGRPGCRTPCFLATGVSTGHS